MLHLPSPETFIQNTHLHCTTIEWKNLTPIYEFRTLVRFGHFSKKGDVNPVQFFFDAVQGINVRVFQGFITRTQHYIMHMILLILRRYLKWGEKRICDLII